jgi:hypothetical protein
MIISFFIYNGNIPARYMKINVIASAGARAGAWQSPLWVRRDNLFFRSDERDLRWVICMDLTRGRADTRVRPYAKKKKTR